MGEAAEKLEMELEQDYSEVESEDIAFLSTGVMDHVWKFGSD